VTWHLVGAFDRREQPMPWFANGKKMFVSRDIADAKGRYSRMAQRYEIRKEPDDLWSIIDVFTGQLATLEGVLRVGLKIQEADDMLYILNNRDLSDRKAKGIA